MSTLNLVIALLICNIVAWSCMLLTGIIKFKSNKGIPRTASDCNKDMDEIYKNINGGI